LKLKYTKSVDGQMRVNHTITIRLTKEELKKIKTDCQIVGFDSWKDAVKMAALDYLLVVLSDDVVEGRSYRDDLEWLRAILAAR
jgi:hypothetical protein